MRNRGWSHITLTPIVISHVLTALWHSEEEMRGGQDDKGGSVVQGGDYESGKWIPSLSFYLGFEGETINS